MSTLKVNTIQDASGGNSSTAEQIAQGRAKVWINFNGGGPSNDAVSIRASFNVSSITDHAVGDYTLNFTNAMANANYAIAGSTIGSTTNYFNHVFGSGDTQLSTGSMRFATAATTNPNTKQDTLINHIIILGD